VDDIVVLVADDCFTFTHTAAAAAAAAGGLPASLAVSTRDGLMLLLRCTS